MSARTSSAVVKSCSRDWCLLSPAPATCERTWVAATGTLCSLAFFRAVLDRARCLVRRHVRHVWSVARRNRLIYSAVCRLALRRGARAATATTTPLHATSSGHQKTLRDSKGGSKLYIAKIERYTEMQGLRRSFWEGRHSKALPSCCCWTRSSDPTWEVGARARCH